MHYFTSLSSYELTGKGMVYIVENPTECMDFAHLLEQVCEIDEWRYTILAVERFAHAPPWREGEPIGLLVKT